MSSPKKNVAYVFNIALVDSVTGDFKTNPTIAAGDFQVSGDGAAFANLATLPVVDPPGSIGVKISLSQTEMNFDKIMVQCIDVAGAEWDDVLIFIDATTANVDDIVRSTTPTNTLDIQASGEADANLTMMGGAVQSATDLKDFADVGYDAVTSKVQGVVLVDTTTNLTNLPSIPANWLTAAGIAADAIGASELATDAVNEIRDAITGGAYALDTDANGRVRIVDGTGAGELDTSGGFVQLLVATQASIDAIEADTNELQTDNVPGLIAALNDLSSANVIAAIEDAGLILIDTTIATLASQTSFTLTAGSGDNSAYVNCLVIIEDASTAAQKAVGMVSVYIGSTKTITLISDPGIFVMAITDKIRILPKPAALLDWIDGQRLDAILDARMAEASISTTGGVVDTITNLTNLPSIPADWLTAAGLATDAVNEIRDAVTGGAYSLDTDANGRVRIVDGTGAGELNTLSGAIVQVDQLGTQAKADVNAELVDVMQTDTHAQPGQGTPPATASYDQMLGYLYKGWRNKKTQTATEFALFNDDAAAVDQKAAVSDDATTFTFGELITGP